MNGCFKKIIVVLDRHIDDTKDYVIRGNLIHPPSLDNLYNKKGSDIYPSLKGEIKNNKFIISAYKDKAIAEMIAENVQSIIFYGCPDNSSYIDFGENLSRLPHNKKYFDKYDLHIDPDCLNKEAIAEICLRNDNPIVKKYFKKNGYVINPCYLGVFGYFSKNDFDAFFRKGIGNLFIGEVLHPIYEKKLVEHNKLKFNKNTIVEAGKELVCHILEKYFEVVNSKRKVFLLDTLGIKEFKLLEEAVESQSNVSEVIFDYVAEKNLSEKLEIRDNVLKEGKVIVISPCHDGAGYLMEDIILSKNF